MLIKTCHCAKLKRVQSKKKWCVLRACVAEQDGTQEMTFTFKKKKRKKRIQVKEKDVAQQGNFPV